MKFDRGSLGEAHRTYYGGDEPKHQEDFDDMGKAITAYLKSTDCVIVPRGARNSAIALLLGLSVYWEDKGDIDQSKHVESVAHKLNSLDPI